MPPTDLVAAEDWVNDSRIGNHEILWRVIIKEWIRPHPLLVGEFIASDQAYRQTELSVFVASQTSRPQVLSRWPGASMVKFSAGFVRDQLGMILVRITNDPDTDPAHRVVGLPNHRRMTSGTARKIALEAKWVELNYPTAPQDLSPS